MTMTKQTRDGILVVWHLGPTYEQAGVLINECSVQETGRYNLAGTSAELPEAECLPPA